MKPSTPPPLLTNANSPFGSLNKNSTLVENVNVDEAELVVDDVPELEDVEAKVTEPVSKPPAIDIFAMSKAINRGYEEPSRSSVAASFSFIALLLVVGLAFAYFGLKPRPIEEMPLPDETYSVSSEEATELVTAEPGDAKLEELKKLNGPGIYIPSIGKITPVIPQNDFESSNYAGFQTLRIPKDPQKASWYSQGGSLWGDEEGTTLVAAHVAYARNRGAFWGIQNMQAGDLVWTKDASGRLQAWATKKIWHAEHKAFPQEYFASDGERQLVVTTCGGRINNKGYFAQNIFLVATPVFIEGATEYVPPAPEPEAGSEVDVSGQVEDVAEQIG